jgi:hypothetical protein
MAKSTEDVTRNYVRGALRAFLEGKKTLNWVVGMVRSSGVRGQRLTEVFDSLKNYSDPSRHQEAFAACREQGWLY